LTYKSIWRISSSWPHFKWHHPPLQSFPQFSHSKEPTQKHLINKRKKKKKTDENWSEVGTHTESLLTQGSSSSRD